MRSLQFLWLLPLYLSIGTWAQRCEFSYYYKKGSVYFFSTYLEGVNQPRQGECIYQDEQGRIYQKRLFKNGIIQEEYTIHFESQKPNTIYHRIDKDTLIGKAQYFDVLGRITQEVVILPPRIKLRIAWIPNGRESVINPFKTA